MGIITIYIGIKEGILYEKRLIILIIIIRLSIIKQAIFHLNPIITLIILPIK